MRFERIRVPAFGNLRELDTGNEALGSLVVVHGPNESGKSTFFEAITTVLYGFDPAGRERHPFTPWSGAEGEIVARLVSDEGVEMSVRRRLLKTGTGHLTVGGDDQALRNRPLEAVEAVSRDLFREVFALTLAELTALSTESWDQLQERLLSHMGARDIVAARTAAGALEDEASKLWRPNRRGHQRVRTLKEEIRELIEARRDAETTDRRVRELTGEAARMGEELERLRTRRERQNLLVERATVLLPLQRRLKRLGDLEEQAQSGPSLDGIPAGIADTLRQLDGELVTLAERRDALMAEQTEPQELADRFSPQMRLTLECRREVTEAGALATQAEAVLAANAQLERKLSELDRRISAASRELFSEPLDEDLARRIAELPLGDLGSRVDRWLEARRLEEEAARRKEASAARPAAWEAVAGTAATIAAVGLLAWGGSASAPGGGAAAFGGLLLAVGAVLLWRWFAGRRRDDDESSPPSQAEPLARVHEILQGLPLREREVDREFVAELRRMQELQQDRTDPQIALEEGRVKIDTAAQAIVALDERLGLELSSQMGAAAQELDRHLTRAERAEEAALGAKRDLARITQELEGIDARSAEATGEREALLKVLSKFGDGDASKGELVLAARQQAAEDATRLQAELRREHPDLEDMVEQIAMAEQAGESWVRDDDALSEARSKLKALSTEIEKLASSIEGIRSEVTHMSEAITADQIDGEVEALREELADAKRERDRMIILAQIIRDADRQFREKNDPDIIDGASEHLSAITHGRYTELVAPEADPSASLAVIDPGTGEEVPVKRLSTGTREQVYFSLRLSIMDRLDAEAERLPVLVDEAFVNWDGSRRGRLMELLQRLGATRQVFIFTCHLPWAEELCERGGRLIILSEEAG